MAYCQCHVHIVENSTTNDIVCMGGKCRQWTISCKTNTHLDAYRYCCIHSLHMQTQVHMQLVIRGIYNFLKGDSLKRPEWLGISDISKVCKTLAKINGKLVFQCFGSIQLPSSGNNDKEALMHIEE